MAVAVGTPVIALHAVTNVAISGPYTRRDDAIDRYPDALMMQLGQTVDECVWGKHVHGFDAMKLISVDAVISRIQWLLPQLIRDRRETPNQEEDC
jgi:heptosyltransferase I